MAIEGDPFFSILFKVSLVESFVDLRRKDLSIEKLSLEPFLILSLF